MASFSSGCERHPLVRPRGDEHKKARRRGWPLLLLGALAIDPNTSLTAASTTPIKVLNAKRLPADNIPAVRVPLGIPNDYKPWIAKLNSRELLMVAFYSREVSDKEKAAGKITLRTGGLLALAKRRPHLGEREERADIKGREFALNVLSDGTILMPCHFLKQDVANNAGHTYSKLFRSVDNGRRWKETRIGPKGFRRRRKRRPTATAEMGTQLRQPSRQLRPDASVTVRPWRNAGKGPAAACACSDVSRGAALYAQYLAVLDAGTAVGIDTSRRRPKPNERRMRAALWAGAEGSTAQDLREILSGSP